MAKQALRKTKKPRKRKEKSTDWSLGQPLDFPPKKTATEIERHAREIVETALDEPSRPRRAAKRKKR